MLSFKGYLAEKKSKILINPKKDELKEVKKNHGEDCDCMKCEQKRRGEDVNDGPDVQNEAKVDKGRSDYGKASIRNYRRSGPGHDDPGMFDPEGKRGKTIDKRREEHKARRGVKGAKVPAYKREEVEVVNEVSPKTLRNYIIKGTQDVAKRASDPDSHSGPKYGKKMKRMDGVMTAADKLAKKASRDARMTEGEVYWSSTALDQLDAINEKDTALDIVKKKIIAQYGKGAIMKKGQPKKVKGAKSTAGTGKYKKMADQKKQTAADAKKRGFKNTSDYIETMARYGGKDNYDKGKGLGTRLTLQPTIHHIMIGGLIMTYREQSMVHYNVGFIMKMQSHGYKTPILQSIMQCILWQD